MPPSTRSLEDLPPIAGLTRLSKALAMLDSILSPEWQYHYYSFNSQWGSGEMMASMRNGSGDEYFALFNEHGAAMKGFDHESVMSPSGSGRLLPWPGMYQYVPAEFSSFLDEPAFSMADVTFCIWRRHSDAAWQCGVTDFPPGDDPDGSEWMLEILDGNPQTYQKFASRYFEVELPLDAIARVYNLEPFNDDLVRSLNPNLDSASVAADAAEIGYPRESD